MLQSESISFDYFGYFVVKLVFSRLSNNVKNSNCIYATVSFLR